MCYFKEGYLEWMCVSGYFWYTWEVVFYFCEWGSAEWIVGMVMSLGLMVVLF